MIIDLGFRPRQGLRRLYGPVREVALYEATVEDQAGAWVEQTPRKLSLTRFDTDGRRRERERFDADGIVIGRAAYSHDPDGRLAERTDYDGDGRAVARHFYRHADHGGLAEVTGVDADGIQVSALRWRYDADGRPREITETDGARETRWILETDEARTVTLARGETQADGAPAGTLEIAYGADGALRAGTCSEADGASHRWRYLYDGPPERDNWTRRVTEREIAAFGEHRFEPRAVTYRRILFFMVRDGAIDREGNAWPKA